MEAGKEKIAQCCKGEEGLMRVCCMRACMHAWYAGRDENTQSLLFALGTDFGIVVIIVAAEGGHGSIPPGLEFGGVGFRRKERGILIL